MGDKAVGRLHRAAKVDLKGAGHLGDGDPCGDRRSDLGNQIEHDVLVLDAGRPRELPLHVCLDLRVKIIDTVANG